jgi:hypothetical protein
VKIKLGAKQLIDKAANLAKEFRAKRMMPSSSSSISSPGDPSTLFRFTFVVDLGGHELWSRFLPVVASQRVSS